MIPPSSTTSSFALLSSSSSSSPSISSRWYRPCCFRINYHFIDFILNDPHWLYHHQSSSLSTIDDSVGEWPILDIVAIEWWCCLSSFVISDSRRADDVGESSIDIDHIIAIIRRCRRHCVVIIRARRPWFHRWTTGTVLPPSFFGAWWARLLLCCIPHF